MFPKIIITTILALALSAVQAHAYAIDCDLAAAGLSSDNEADNAVVAGAMFGTTDMLAGLLCFVGDPRCFCLQGLIDRPEAFGGAVGRRLRTCIDTDGSQPFFGVSYGAALELCPR